jgi:general stress protein 26
MSSPEHKAKIWNLINDIKVGMLVTQEGEHLRARPMHLVQDDYDGTIWFFTNTESDKVFEIEKDRDVCLTFEDHDDDVYVSMTGKARLTKDKELINRFWGPFVDPWFPGGKDSDEVGLIEIKINAGEHWDGDAQIVQLFKFARSNLVTNEVPDVGENEKFGTA